VYEKVSTAVKINTCFLFCPACENNGEFLLPASDFMEQLQYLNIELKVLPLFMHDGTCMKNKTERIIIVLWCSPIGNDVMR
jgi:hypothetical protein